MVDENSTDPPLTRIARIIQAELALYPGRVSLIVRIVLACTISMALIMIFRIPAAALGAYYPLLLSRDSPRSTRRSAIRTAAICTLATAEVIIGAMLFAGSPFLHLFWVAGNLFLAFFLISSLTLYDAALAAGLLLTNAITTWDLPLSSDARVTQTLYTLLAILIGCAVSVGVEYFLAGTHSTDAVRDGIQQRLSLVGKLLDGLAEADTSVLQMRAQLSKLADQGVGYLRQQLVHSSYENRYRERLTAALNLSGRLVELSAALCELPPPASEEDRAHCAVISSGINAICASLAREEAPDQIDLPESRESDMSLLTEIERTVDLISQSLTDQDSPVHHHLPEPGEEPHLPSFVADAFTNRRHVRFAIRGTLSALACYLLYMSVGWTGLGASIATCVLTALTSRGASRHKQLMRFAGMIVGACVLGFTIQTVLLPQIDSLFTYSLIFAAVIALGAWVSTSGPRIAYAGAQIVLAYDLVNLNRFTIATSLVPARDVVLGIVLGIAAMWLIFDHLWASPTSELTRKAFLSTFQAISTFEPPAGSPAPAQARYVLAECDRINAQLDRVRSLVDVSVFEAHPKSQEEIYLGRCVKALQPELRAFLLLDSGLLLHAISSGQPLSEPTRNIRENCRAILRQTVDVIDNKPAKMHIWTPEFPAIRPIQDQELRLSASLLALARHLHSSATALAIDAPTTAKSRIRRVASSLARSDNATHAPL